MGDMNTSSKIGSHYNITLGNFMVLRPWRTPGYFSRPRSRPILFPLHSRYLTKNKIFKSIEMVINEKIAQFDEDLETAKKLSHDLDQQKFLLFVRLLRPGSR